MSSHTFKFLASQISREDPGKPSPCSLLPACGHRYSVGTATRPGCPGSVSFLPERSSRSTGLSDVPDLSRRHTSPNLGTHKLPFYLLTGVCILVLSRYQYWDTRFSLAKKDHYTTKTLWSFKTCFCKIWCAIACEIYKCDCGWKHKAVFVPLLPGIAVLVSLQHDCIVCYAV